MAVSLCLVTACHLSLLCDLRGCMFVLTGPLKSEGIQRSSAGEWFHAKLRWLCLPYVSCTASEMWPAHQWPVVRCCASSPVGQATGV